jgi:hypothetical protein
MGSVSFPDRFELLDVLRQDMLKVGQVQTFQARERATGRLLEAHFFEADPDLDHLNEQQRGSLIDRGSHDGKWYVVTAPLPSGVGPWFTTDPVPLDSAGAWRIRPSAEPKPSAPPEPSGAVPGDFTRMFQLRQAPQPVAAPASNAAVPKPVQAGEFTRAFQRPAASPPAALASSAPGQPGEFTRMFQQPARPSASPASAPPAVPQALDHSVPAPPAPSSQPRGVFIAIALVLLFVIAMIVWMRRLY